MSGPPPPRPGQKAPNNVARYGPRILLGGLLIGVAYTYAVYKPPKPEGTIAANPLRTPGVQNIEGAYQKGGATSTHTKGYGGTILGTKDDASRQGDGAYGSGKEKGFEDVHTGDDQRPGSANKAAEKFKDMKYGVGKDK